MAEAILDLRLDTVRPNRVRLVYGVQNDYNSRYICVRFTVNGKPIDIEGTAAVRINAKRPDDKKDAFPGTVNTDGTVKVPVAQWMLEVPGEVSASVTAITSNSALTTTHFYIQAQYSVWDGTSAPSADDPNKDVIVSIIAAENERVANENARISAETERVNNEKTRVDNENIRIENEGTRQALHEEMKTFFGGVENVLTNKNVAQELGDETDKVPSVAATRFVTDNLNQRLESAEQKIEQGLNEEEITKNAISATEKWLDEHPEATTTVQDGSLTEAKFTDELKLYSIKDYVTPQMFGAKGDGVTDDTVAIKTAITYLGDFGTLFFPKGSYLISESLTISTAITLKGDGIDISNICAASAGEYTEYLINFTKPSKGGGICDITVTNSVSGIHESVSGVSIGSGVSSVASAFKCHHIKIKQFVNGLNWHTDWQAYFDHIYIINCSDTGFIINGSDTEFSNINISKCKCGMHIGAGTSKISNLKIDNCNTGGIHAYALRIYGKGTQIVNGEVQFCFPSGVIVTSPQNMLDLRIDGIGMDALYEPQTGGYFLATHTNAKNNIFRVTMIDHGNEIISHIHDPKNCLYSENKFECVSTKDIPLWCAVNKMPSSEITGNAFIQNDLATLRNKTYVTGTMGEDGFIHVESQIDIRLLQSFFPNANTDKYTSILKIVTNKEIQTPFYWYGVDSGKNNNAIKLHQTYIDGKYTTYYLNYSEKMSGNVAGLIVKSKDEAEMKIFDLKALFYGENITVDFAKNIMFTL